MKKYYYPKVEDLYVGYECLVLAGTEFKFEFYRSKEDWDELNLEKEGDYVRKILSSEDIQEVLNCTGDGNHPIWWQTPQDYINDNFKVAYLREEDIIRDGWKEEYIPPNKKIYKKDNWMLGLYLKEGKIPKVFIHPLDPSQRKDERLSFDKVIAECPSINEFRKLMKMIW